MSKNKILVPLDKKSYEVFIESGLLDDIGNQLINLGIKNTRKILIISNKEIADLFGKTAGFKADDPNVIPDTTPASVEDDDF